VQIVADRGDPISADAGVVALNDVVLATIVDLNPTGPVPVALTPTKLPSIRLPVAGEPVVPTM